MALQVRPAQAHERARIVALSGRVQAALNAAGSRQQIGPLRPDDVRHHVQARAAYVLDEPTRQGQGLGRLLLDQVRLICLRGIFPEEDYAIAVFTWSQ